MKKWFTDMSAEGLHLVRPGYFRYQFEQDPGIRYI
ncbi:DUF2812 domain-containing protein [Paenibacillus koleovorans]|nr:DUF2812 domain-containing protein [Paenibacillus koleovorans]